MHYCLAVSSIVYRVNAAIPAEIKTNYTYLANGNLSSVVHDGVAPYKVSEAYSYDTLERVSESSYYYSTGATTAFFYRKIRNIFIVKSQ